MSQTTLIQIVSEQTMQNILPALALKPNKLFHLCTEKMMPKSAHIVEALRQTGTKINMENINLAAVPTISEVSKLIQVLDEEIRKSGATSVVNFTGGTKIMSIGAHQGACAAKIPSLYVDTEHGTFIDGNSGTPITEIIGGDLSFTSLQRELSIDILSRANGAGNASPGKGYKHLSELANYLLKNRKDEKTAWEAIYGKNGLASSLPNKKSPKDYLNLIEKPINLSPKLIELAQSAGIIERRNANAYLALTSEIKQKLLDLDSKYDYKKGRFHADWHFENFFKSIEPIEEVMRIFSGAWWEVVVAEAIENSGLFRDIRWSANVGFKKQGTRMEEDILAIRGVNLAYFSCKRGGDKSKLSRLLEEVDASARRIGGAFAEKYLAIYIEPSGIQKTKLEHRAKQLNIKILTPNNIMNIANFA